MHLGRNLAIFPNYENANSISKTLPAAPFLHAILPQAIGCTRRTSDCLRNAEKMFPAKAIDKEWEEMARSYFGVHIGWDSEGEDSTVIEVGDHVNATPFTTYG